MPKSPDYSLLNLKVWKSIQPLANNRARSNNKNSPTEAGMTNPSKRFGSKFMKSIIWNYAYSNAQIFF